MGLPARPLCPSAFAQKVFDVVVDLFVSRTRYLRYSLMGKAHTIRFASGHPEMPFSGVWRLVVNRDDVYLGFSKDLMGSLKISLHQSGVWVLAATMQSCATFENGNRRAMQWERPVEHAPGVTRGPSILVPHTSLGSRALLPNDDKKKVVWFPGPDAGHMVEFSLYFVASGAATSWDIDLTVLGEHRLSSAKRVILLASSPPMPADFAATVEKILRDSVARIDNPSSNNARRIPIIVDLPPIESPPCA